jgi:hypothetical protein
MVVEIEGTERDALLNLSLTLLDLPIQPTMKTALTIHALQRDHDLNIESKRIADLIFNRVDASGSLQQRTAPLRNAPTDLLLRVAEKLPETPLICALCGGIMSIRPQNRLLQPSPDRIDSAIGSYGPENFQLTHLACNLAKSNATVEQFEEWLILVRAAHSDEGSA